MCKAGTVCKAGLQALLRLDAQQTSRSAATAALRAWGTVRSPTHQRQVGREVSAAQRALRLPLLQVGGTAEACVVPARQRGGPAILPQALSAQRAGWQACPAAGRWVAGGAGALEQPRGQSLGHPPPLPPWQTAGVPAAARQWCRCSKQFG